MADDFRRAKRQYASFFFAPRKYRSEQELSIVQHVYASLETNDTHYGYEINKNDPPDIIVKENTGVIIGVEVTELVSKRAIEAQIHGDQATELNELLGWNDEKIIEAIGECIKLKSCVTPQVVATFDRYVLVIHTDEPRLTYEKVQKIAQNFHWQNHGQIDECYILFSYDPGKKISPVLKLF